MKRALKWIIGIVAAAIIMVFAAYGYYGGFRTPAVAVENTGGETFVYENMIGDYAQSPKYMDDVYYFLRDELGIHTTKCVGVYLDHPDEVAVDERRSEVGCILDNTVDSITMAKIEERYNVHDLPYGTYVTTVWPNKGRMSIVIGIIKVYPAMERYIQENGYIETGPVMEVYDQPTKQIIYRQKVAKR